MKKTPGKNKFLALRVTEEQLARITQSAATQNLTASEWIRDVVTKATAPDPSLQALAEEVIAVRLILQNFIMHVLEHNLISEDTLKQVCATADRDKKARVRTLFPFNLNQQSSEDSTNVQ